MKSSTAVIFCKMRMKKTKLRFLCSAYLLYMCSLAELGGENLWIHITYNGKWDYAL